MAKKTLPQVVKELLSESGLPNAVYVGEWENQAVYHPIFGDGQPSVGLPSYILHADDTALSQFYIRTDLCSVENDVRKMNIGILL